LRSRPVQPLLAGTARSRAVGLLACCALLVVVLGVLFADQPHGDWLGHAIDTWVSPRLYGHEQLLLWLAAPAPLIPAGLVSLIMVVVCLRAGRLNGAGLAASGLPPHAR